MAARTHARRSIRLQRRHTQARARAAARAPPAGARQEMGIRLNTARYVVIAAIGRCGRSRKNEMTLVLLQLPETDRERFDGSRYRPNGRARDASGRPPDGRLPINSVGCEPSLTEQKGSVGNILIPTVKGRGHRRRSYGKD